jgi:hypothetical protein
MIDINKSFACNPKSKYWSSLNNIKPNEVYKSTSNKYYFDCPDCNHTFDIGLDNISCLGQWCPYCSNIKLCDNNKCIICFNKSFMSIKKSEYWSNTNIISPRKIFKYSNKKFIFYCNICKHEFEASPNNITQNKWCPYCAKPCKKLCDNIHCEICFNNSFYSNYNSLFWSNTNNIHPRYVIKNSKNKYWFDCHECNHSFEISLDNANNKKWCPYCGHVKLCDITDCNNCFNNSFNSVENSKYLIDKNINTRQIFKYTKQKYDFECNICHNTFKSSIHHISDGSWCSLCRYKTQKILYNWLIQNFKHIKQQIKYKWCINKNTNKHLIFDFEVENKIIIELDGAQHFRQISNWLNPEIQKERDKFKIKCALENNRHIIHILQEDVYNNIGNWDKKLKEHINNLLLIDKPDLVLIGIDENHFN